MSLYFSRGDRVDGQNLQDCFTHISFFHALLRLRLRLLGDPAEPSPAYSLRGGDAKASSGERRERPKAWKVAAWLSRGNGISSSVGEGIVGKSTKSWLAKLRGRVHDERSGWSLEGLDAMESIPPL